MSTTASSQSRRRFLLSAGATGVSTTLPGVSAAQVGAASSPAKPSTTAATMSSPTIPIRLVVNGTPRSLEVAPNAVLLDVLHDQLELHGTHKGCDLGQCGACTMHVNGTAVNACLSLAVMHDGDAITTVEGLERDGKLHPLQQAFWDHDAYQCGYCTAGQLMNAVALLDDPNIGPDDHALREAMSGNLCRCGAYRNIVAAIQEVRSTTRKRK